MIEGGGLMRPQLLKNALLLVPKISGNSRININVGCKHPADIGFGGLFRDVMLYSVNLKKDVPLSLMAVDPVAQCRFLARVKSHRLGSSIRHDGRQHPRAVGLPTVQELDGSRSVADEVCHVHAGRAHKTDGIGNRHLNGNATRAGLAIAPALDGAWIRWDAAGKWSAESTVENA